jgi:hypothetical protein
MDLSQGRTIVHRRGLPEKHWHSVLVLYCEAAVDEPGGSLTGCAALLPILASSALYLAGDNGWVEGAARLGGGRKGSASYAGLGGQRMSEAFMGGGGGLTPSGGCG